MKTFHKQVWLVAASILFCFTPAYADKNEKLGAVEITGMSVALDESDSNFTVIDARMDETATAAVLFGLVGAAVNSASNASEDKVLTDVYRETAAEIDLASLIKDNLISTINKKQSVPLVSEGELASHDLEVEIKDWGMVRISNASPEMRIFLNLRVIMKENGKSIWDTRRHDAGKHEAIFSDFTEEIFVEQVNRLAQKSGQRIAYEIIYR